MNFKDPFLIEDLFNNIAPNYDILNDLLSFGLHRVWKRKMLDWLNPMPGEYWVDLCCGTGDIALNLASKVTPKGKVLGIDFAKKTLDIARDRHLKLESLPISWMKLDACNTGLESHAYDGVTMAYGLRNLKSPYEGLKEIYRLLKPGAKALILDFNKMPEKSISHRMQKFYLRNIVVKLASIYGLKEEYEYIENSLMFFPNGTQLESLAKKIGFSKVRHQSIILNQMLLLYLQA